MTTGSHQVLSDVDYKNALLVWDYLQMKHELIPCDVAIALGGHDIGVAHFAAELYHRGLFPTLVFTGANSPSTAELFPRGEAVEFGELAIQLGVPAQAILIEDQAANTGQNIAFSRTLLTEAGFKVSFLLFISMPSMERRAYATCRQQWPEVKVLCSSAPQPFGDYLTSTGDERIVIEILVGDMQRVVEYPRLGFQIAQDVPADVMDAYRLLIDAGYTSRLM